jgi:hypothetical protein
VGDSPPDAYKQYIAAKTAAEVHTITVAVERYKRRWGFRRKRTDEEIAVAAVTKLFEGQVVEASIKTMSTAKLRLLVAAIIVGMPLVGLGASFFLAKATGADHKHSFMVYGVLVGLLFGAVALLVGSLKSTEFWGATKTLLKGIGLLLTIPVAIVVLLGLASAATSKDPDPKKILKPQSPETWRSQYPRGSHMNLDGIYEVDGVFRLDRSGHTYFLAADDEWHLLETSKPSGASTQGRYS